MTAPPLRRIVIVTCFIAILSFFQYNCNRTEAFSPSSVGRNRAWASCLSRIASYQQSTYTMLRFPSSKRLISTDGRMNTFLPFSKMTSLQEGKSMFSASHRKSIVTRRYVYRIPTRLLSVLDTNPSTNSSISDINGASEDKETNLIIPLDDDDDDDEEVVDDEEYIIFGDKNNEKFFFDETCESGDSCRLMDFDYNVEMGEGYYYFSDNEEDRYDHQLSLAVEKTLTWAPIFCPILAYLLYDPTAAIFAKTLDVIANNKWFPVDGGAYQAKIIAPAINGVVIPAMSLLFANLIATTVTTLRQRQMDITTAINTEAGQIRRLTSLLDVFVSDVPESSYSSRSSNNPLGQLKKLQSKCRTYLLEYTSRLIAECHESVNYASLDTTGMDSELNGLLTALNRHCANSNSEIGNAPSPIILSETYNAVNTLSQERSNRITALQSTFPQLHYVIICFLALSICLTFLMETNQDILVFLNAIQLRILWTIIVGTFCALAAVIYDIQHPFRGTYKIAPQSVNQLYTIRSTLLVSLDEQQKQESKFEQEARNQRKQLKQAQQQPKEEDEPTKPTVVVPQQQQRSKQRQERNEPKASYYF